MHTVTSTENGGNGRSTPRRALLEAVALGRVPAWYLRQTFEMRNTDLRLALVEATHMDVTGDA